MYSKEIKVNSIPQSSSKGKAMIRTPVHLNKASGKESTAAYSFSEQNWGSATRKLTAAIARQTLEQISGVVELAWAAWLTEADPEEAMTESVDEYSMICKLTRTISSLTDIQVCPRIHCPKGPNADNGESTSVMYIHSINFNLIFGLVVLVLVPPLLCFVHGACSFLLDTESFYILITIFHALTAHLHVFCLTDCITIPKLDSQLTFL